MHDEAYSDGIGEITVSSTVVRIDLVSLSPTERDGQGNPKSVFQRRIIMPIDVFANSAELMRKALDDLIAAGAVQRTPPRAPASDGAQVDRAAVDRIGLVEPTPQADQTHGPGRNRSPNFQ